VSDPRSGSAAPSVDVVGCRDCSGVMVGGGEAEQDRCGDVDTNTAGAINRGSDGADDCGGALIG